MGNYNTRSIKFRQSVNDFPLTVALGEKSPAWELSRWAGNGGLRFIPFDDEGFTMQGDKKRLVYKGRRRSHRFTILNDGAFEYDCILLREPESNVISLRMEGAENFEFFWQPDFVPDPFLKGSYAVYKKETLLGEGTGKLCHIHRPEIIDARGRRCWGILTVIGNELHITIPEQWLSEAVYPVVVDPTIGTTTVGSQYLIDDDPPEPPRPLWFEGQIPVNRFLVNEAIQGNCTAYFYCNDDEYGDAGGKGVIFSDNGNYPQYRKTKQEQWIDFTVSGSKPKGWRSGNFAMNENIASGSYIWFGCWVDFFWMPRFDFGARCYAADFWRDYWDLNGNLYDTYPTGYANWYIDTKLSMYFTYTSSQNYVRTLTQGITLTDLQKHTAEYKRVKAETVKGSTSLKNVSSFIRWCLAEISITDTLQQWRVYIRGLYDIAKNSAETSRQGNFYRNETETVQAEGSVFRGLLIFVKILTTSLVRDFVLRRFLVAREELVLKSYITREITLESKIA